LQQAIIVKKPVTKILKIQFDYIQMNEIMQVLRKYECEIINREMGLFCVFELEVPVQNYPTFIDLSKTLKGVDIV